MNTEETLRKVNEVALFVVVAFAIFIFFALWSMGWITGYEQGHRVSKAYYETLGELPSQEWINDENNWHLDRKYLILDSLEVK